MRALNAAFSVSSTDRVQIVDVTTLVSGAVRQLQAGSGIALINTLHTTCALFLNEFQDALVGDLRALMERLVPERNGYRHNDPRVSDCERGNAQAHLRAALFGRSIALGVSQGELTLGRFQSIIFAEFDGPRKREISIQIVGE